MENQEQPPPDTTGAETGGQEGEEPSEDESQMVVEDAVEEEQEEGKEGEGEPTEQDEKPGIVTVVFISRLLVKLRSFLKNLLFRADST